MSAAEIGLPEALERAAGEFPDLADRIRPANGDPHQLGRELEPESARRLLGWLLAEWTAAGEELARTWAEAPETRDVLRDFDASGLPKPARKAVARLTHHLRSRGQAPPAAPPPPRASGLAPLAEHIDEARISAPDPYGARAVFLAQDRPAGGVRLFQLVIQDEQGALEFQMFETGRSKARRFLRELVQGNRWPAAEAPAESVRALIAEALEAQPADRALPTGLGDWRAKLSEHAESTPRPAELVRQALGAAGSLEAEKLEAWFEAGEVGPWPPPAAQLKTLIERLKEIAEGQVVVSPAAREEQVDAALESALDEVYDGERQSRLAGRFEETAYVWWKAGREDEARALLAAAEALRAGEPNARRLCRRMLEISLKPALDRARSGEAAPETGPAAPSPEPG